MKKFLATLALVIFVLLYALNAAAVQPPAMQLRVAIPKLTLWSEPTNKSLMEKKSPFAVEISYTKFPTCSGVSICMFPMRTATKDTLLNSTWCMVIKFSCRGDIAKTSIGPSGQHVMVTKGLVQLLLIATTKNCW